MKAIVLRPFVDKKEGVTRKPGDTFIVSKERYKELNSVLKLVAEVAEETKPKSTTKKRGAKK